MKTDARTRYTKTVIKKCLLRLLHDKAIEKISVTEICNMAEINRATFYRHYDNQYDLLSEVQNEMLDDIKRITDTANDLDGLFGAVFKEFYMRKDEWLLLLSDNGDTRFIGKIYAFFAERFVNEKTTEENKMLFRYMLYGNSGLFEYWIKGGMKESPEVMTKYAVDFRHRLIEGIK